MIVQVGPKAVGNVSELMTAVASIKPGTTAPFTLLRGDGRLTLDVATGTRPRASARN